MGDKIRPNVTRANESIMKLIHLPTGEELDYGPNIAEAVLNAFPTEFIRAKLPKYWRVEGYDKSWEYMEGINKEKPTKNWEWVSNKSIHGPTFVNGFDSDTIWPKKLPKISRAEFEYHIYNRWKRVKDEMAQMEKGISNIRLNEQLEMSDVDRSAWKTPSPLYKHMAENHNVTLLASEESDIEQIVLNDIDTLKQQAEKMGYELVRKPKEPMEWVCESHAFLINDNGIDITDRADDEGVFLDFYQIETLIEKYNQFKNI
jgi:hypothetical protein